MTNQAIVDDFVAPPCKGVVRILYQDNDILLINKPSGLLSLSGKNPLNWDSVHHRLVHGQQGESPAFLQASLPHRLDFGTSGIMVVGLHRAATTHLNKQFQAGSITKRYVAMLDGWLEHEHGQISAAIAKDVHHFPRVKICHATGKTAISDYVVLQRFDKPRRTLVEYSPLTGRTHQLRIHSLLIGHPIVGCDLYHAEGSQPMAERLLLHARDIDFLHPSSGELTQGQCPSPF
ncbi:RluA family pseudouridine synthase [Paraglaciecola sp.]|uniref:RluA family pseudouridine synthase n=1 Tax=Paraglaciecola sp. TaxID=1920173 RepID=UPI00273F6695|nr:RluA family pseudouridine synthase [Paraglaciecola sp.]MDP5029883.1 RluA family pseudouridine synthase [Paraglaciecola sp.]